VRAESQNISIRGAGIPRHAIKRPSTFFADSRTKPLGHNQRLHRNNPEISGPTARRHFSVSSRGKVCWSCKASLTEVELYL